MKKITLKAAFVLACAALAACEDDGPGIPAPLPDPVGETGFCVVNQGNMYGGVAGTLDAFSFADSSYTANCFEAVNGRSLGDSPQQGIVYGSRIYLPVYGSDLVWVLDRRTLSVVNAVATPSPEAVCAADGYVFVAGNDGFVSRLDTVSLAVDCREAVGPNPSGLAAHAGRVYVTVSDGYNSAGGYAGGLRVAVVDAATGKKETDIAVGVNPGQIVYDDASGDLFVVCRGDYGSIGPKVQRIDLSAGCAVSDFAEGSLVAADGRGSLLVIDLRADYATNTAAVTGRLFSTATGEVLAPDFFGASAPAMPQAVDVNPATGHYYVCSDNGPLGYAQSGFVYEYDGRGSLLRRYDAGIHPFGVIFR